MRPMSWAVACALVTAGAVAACGLYPYLEEPAKKEPVKTEPAKKTGKEQVKEMMIKLHKGEKSPLARTRAEVEKEKPDWDQLAADAKAFGELSELLKKNREGYRSPEQYISSAAELAKAAKDKDHKAVSAAVGKLSKSCMACHFYNGHVDK
jgi:cytochrome c556